MKQSLSKQLLMLAILLFAGMGSAWGANKSVNISVTYNGNTLNNAVEVTVNATGHSTLSTQSGEDSFSFPEGIECQLWISVLDDNYSLQSVTVGGSEVDVAAFADNDSYNMGFLQDDTNVEIVLQDLPSHIITLNADVASLRDIYLHKVVNNEWRWLEPISKTEQQIQWKAPDGFSYYLNFRVKNSLTYHISSIWSGNDNLLPEYLENEQYLYFEDNAVDKEVTVGLAKNDDVDLKTITINRSDFYDQENNSKAKTIFTCLSKDYVKDYTGITEFTGWSQFGADQEPSVVADPDGVAITVDYKTGQLWQPQVTVVPFGSLSLKEGGNYKVIVTAKFPSDGTLQINMGDWNVSDQNTVDVVSTGGFQEVEVLFQDYPDDAEGAHVLFQCGDFLGTTIVKKVQVIDLDGGAMGVWSEEFESDSEENDFLSDKIVRMRLQPEVGWQVNVVKVDDTNVDFSNGYYDFEDDNDHSVKVTFGELTTHTISTTMNKGHLYFSFNNENRWVYPGESVETFNEGTHVTMHLDPICNVYEWDETNQTDVMKLYKVSTLTIDGDVVALSTLSKDEEGWYIYDGFGALDADHTITVGYSEVPSNAITATYTVGGVYLNGNWVGSDDKRLFETGSDVTMTIWSRCEGRNEQTDESVLYKLTALWINGNEVALKNLQRDNDNNYIYLFNSLNYNATVELTYSPVTRYKITVNIDRDNYEYSYVYLNGDYAPDGPNNALQFEEDLDVEMVIPHFVGVYDNIVDQYYRYLVTFAVDGQDVDENDYTINENDQYVYTFSNLSSDHEVTLAYEKCPSITVNVFDSDNDDIYSGQVKFNGESRGFRNAVSFVKGSNVEMVLDLNAGWVISSITQITGNAAPVDITDQYNNGYTFENLNEDVIVNVKANDIGAYSIDVYFDENDVITKTTTTAYLKSTTQEKEKTFHGRFTKGEDVTLYIKTAIGYEVTSVSVNGNEVDVDDFFTYDNETKEYKHVFPNLKNYYGVEITTRKKVHDTNQTVHYRLGKAVGGTLCSEYDLDFSGFDKNKLSAYVASGYDPVTGLIALTRVWYVPAGTGLMLKGEVNDYEIPVTNTQFYYSNMFKGIVVETFVDKYETDDDGTTYKNYVLKNGLFYELDGDQNSKLQPNKAYLRIPAQYVPENTNQARRTIGVVFNDDDTTYINDIQTDNAEDGDYYNLNGQKVQTPQKGIYIKNGKKVIIR